MGQDRHGRFPEKNPARLGGFIADILKQLYLKLITQTRVTAGAVRIHCLKFGLLRAVRFVIQNNHVIRP